MPNKKNGETEVSLEALLKHVKNSKGNVALIARRTGCGRTTIYDYIKRWPEVGVAIEAERETKTDNAESQLQKLIDTPIKDYDRHHVTALIFYLKTQGRKRGYGNQVDVNINDALARKVEQLVEKLDAAGLDAGTAFDQMIQQLAEADAERSRTG